MQKIILTGDRPSGKLHLGHYAGSLMSRVQLQTLYKQYVMIADMQALTDGFANSAVLKENIFQVLQDYLAVGINPEQTTIFIQSQIPELAELTMYFMNLVHLGRLQRNPTVKTELQQKGLEKQVPVGFVCYPISQASDIAAFKASLVPVGNDQLPILEQACEIIAKFNKVYQTDILIEPQSFLSKTARLMGIDGKAKASKSLGNAIFLDDSPDAVRQKVFAMYTDPDHLKVCDPGKVEGNIVFDYLDAFCPDKEKVAELKAHYQKGGLGDTVIKEVLNQVLQNLLEPIRQCRQNLHQDYLRDILIEGGKAAKEQAAQTLAQVRSVMHINYFN